MEFFDVKNLSRITLTLGHYGSGKSELAINLALGLIEASEDDVYLADLDVVNPYFRSREQIKLLSEKGIKVVSSAEDFPDVDLPYMPETMSAIIQNRHVKGVVDAGGDASGARVLARYALRISEESHSVLMVVNANRPSTRTPLMVIKYIEEIQQASSLKITGLVNNTHLLNHTEPSDIIKGAGLVQEVSEATGIPIMFHCAPSWLLRESPEELEQIKPLFPMGQYLKKPWEK